jgi:hypothetical protein
MFYARKEKEIGGKKKRKEKEICAETIFAKFFSVFAK